MSRFSILWASMTAVLTGGGLLMAGLAVTVAGLHGELVGDGVVFAGAALAALVATLASGRRDLWTPLAGALATMLGAFGLMLAAPQVPMLWSLDEGALVALALRKAGLGAVGALVGASLVLRWFRRPALANRGALWFAVSLLASLGLALLFAFALMASGTDVENGDAMVAPVFLAPLVAGFLVQLVAPVRRVAAIGFGAGAMGLVGLFDDPEIIGAIALTALILSFVGAIGARIAAAITRPPQALSPDVELPRVTSLQDPGVSD